MGDKVGKVAVEGQRERERQNSLPPQPIRQFSDLAQGRSLGHRDSLDVVACPTAVVEPTDGEVHIGPYNPLSLAGQALSLSASLSPDYLQAYLSGLEDLMALKSLPESSTRRKA